MKKTRIKRFLITIGIALLALALVGCGGEKREKFDLSTPDGTLKEIVRAYNEGDWERFKEFTVGADAFLADRESFIDSLNYDEESLELLNEKLQFIELTEVSEPIENQFAEGVFYMDVECRSYEIGDQMIADASEHALAGEDTPISQDFEDVDTFLTGFNATLAQDEGSWKLHLTFEDPSFTNNEPLVNLFLGDIISASDDWIIDNHGTPPVPTREVAVGDYSFVWPE